MNQKKLLPAIVCLACSVTVAPAAEPARMPLLMPDDFDQMNVVFWRVEPAAPDAENPLLEGDTPWDAGGVMTHGTVLRDPIDGLYKAWIICTPPEEELAEVSTRNHYDRRLCYFESTDGVHWTRPNLPDSALGDHQATNVVFDDTDDGGTQYASVNVDPANRAWPYEMFVYRNMYGRTEPGHTHLHHYRSPNGKTWELVHGPIKGPFTSDVCFIYPARFLDPDRDGGYVAYYRVGAPDPEATIPVYEGSGSTTRQLYRAESRDGKEWVDAEKIIMRDERDHRDTQYMELVPERVPGGYLGVVSIYHPITQTLNLRLAASRDGRRWWFPDRRPCLDNPPLGEYGSGMIWQSKSLVAEGERLYVYYGGMEGLHRPIVDTRGQGFRQIGMDSVLDRPHGFLPFNSALCRASWRVDRLYALVSAAGGFTVGTAVTKPRRLAGRQLRVNFLTRPPKKSTKPGFDEGYLQVELLDAQGNPLPGFTRDDCPRLKGDHRALVVKWAGGDRAPEQTARAKFTLKRAFLYGFELGPPPSS
ncbi:MAG TPA: hypothetical protein VMY37_26990 [Thermoguttaceae bacterium]|nr:hypothetical protein [Thermoguttaceae bacterium]